MPSCIACFEELPEGFSVCPQCGFDSTSQPEQGRQLPPGTFLEERYSIGRVLGSGGFGITYLAFDTKLGRKVAIKEYLPSDLATRTPGNTAASVFTGNAEDAFRKGLDSFIREAQRLAMLSSHDGIVTIYDSLYANETGYIVMELLSGTSLKERIATGGPMPYAQSLAVIRPVLEALAAVHAAGIIHRDVAPDNIIILGDGSVRLIDFGAAREATQGSAHTMTVVLKPGYAPPEQYRSNGSQGPWTDVYAAAATFYRMLTGLRPQESLERVAEDSLAAPSAVGAAMPPAAEAALMAALATDAGRRTQSAEALLSGLLQAGGVPEPAAARAAVPEATVLVAPAGEAGGGGVYVAPQPGLGGSQVVGQPAHAQQAAASAGAYGQQAGQQFPAQAAASAMPPYQGQATAPAATSAAVYQQAAASAMPPYQGQVAPAAAYQQAAAPAAQAASPAAAAQQAAASPMQPYQGQIAQAADPARQPYQGQQKRSKKAPALIAGGAAFVLVAAVAVLFVTGVLPSPLGILAPSEQSGAPTGSDANQAGESPDSSSDSAQDEPAPAATVKTTRTVFAESASASSVLPAVYENGIYYDYTANNTLNADNSSKWTEGTSGGGEGEYISYRFSSPKSMTGLYIKNGNWREMLYMEGNNRIRELKVSFDDGTSETFVLADPIGGSFMQDNAEHGEKLTFSKPHMSASATLTVVSIYQGSFVNNDLCVSQVEFLIEE